jgi:hypothetical protein
MDRDISSIKSGQVNIQVNQDNIKDDLLRSQQSLREDINKSLQALTNMVTVLATKTSLQSPETPASVSSIESRNFESINVPIEEYIYEGREMVTCSVIFKEGSKVFWKYGNDLMRDVTIIEVFCSTKLPFPSYYVEFGHGESHLVRHDELYIPSDSAPTMSSNGTIDATESLMPVAAQLHMCVMKEKNPRLLKMYDAMNDEKFKLETLTTSFKDLVLTDDKLHSNRGV